MQIHHLRKLFIIVGAAAALSIPHSEAAVAPAPALIAFHISAQQLSEAVLRFSDETGVQVLFGAPLAKGVRANAVQGRYSVADALDRLLEGTGLSWRYLNAHTITIEPKPAAAAKGPSFGMVQVEGANQQAFPQLNGFGPGVGAAGSSDVTATEGTGSYTTNGASIGSKTPLSLQETPQSVSVITQQQMEDQDLTDLTALMNQMPGISVITNNATQAFFSRGFQIQNFQFDGGAATNPYFSETGGPEIDMAEYDHVEVLRGADGMFSGTGDPGGTVNLVRKRPLDHDQVVVDLEGGSWQDYRGMLDVTGPLDPSLFGTNVRARLVVSEQSQDYFYQTANSNHNLVYGIVEADLTPSTLLTVGGSYTKWNDVPWFNGLMMYANGQSLGLPRSASFALPWNRNDNSEPEVFAQLDQKISQHWSVHLKFTTLNQTINQKYASLEGAVDPSTLQGATFFATQSYGANRSDLGSLTVNGDFDFLGQKQSFVWGADLQYVSAAGSKSYPFLDMTADSIDPFTFNPSAYPEPASNPPITNDTVDYEKQSSTYMTLRFTPISRLHLTGGFRLEDDEQAATTVNLGDLAIYNDPTCGCAYLESYSDRNVITPYGAVNYDFTKTWTGYFSFTDTFVSQAFELQGPPPGTPLKPILGKDYEAGIKGDLMHGALNTSISAYQIYQRNAGILDPSYPYNQGADGSTCCFLAAENLQSRGVDAEITGRLARGWQISASYTFNEQEILYDGAASPNNGALISYGLPKHLWKIWSTYEFPGPLKDLTLGLGVDGQTAAYEVGSVCSALTPGIPGCLNGTPFDITQPTYAIVSARVAYRMSKRLSVALVLGNILDKSYYQSIGDTTEGNFYGNPRNFMLTLHYSN